MEIGWHQFTINQEDNQNSSENSDESPPSPKAASTSSPKRSKRGAHKRVVHVPIKEVESSRQLKGETNAPPLDSWAWRKYGQKPIKGSPYPRGYYRCSSSKGCPARKQVERSRTDPTMVMVTYSCDHNHPWPASRNNISHHHLNPPPSPPTVNTDDQLEDLEPELEPEPEHEPEPEPEPELETEHEPKSEQKFTSLELGSCGPFVSTSDQYGWFSDFDTPSSTMLESPLMTRDIVEDSDMTKIFSIREDEESFFADLGELPECATVFRRREIERAEEHRRNLAPWCGTTG